MLRWLFITVISFLLIIVVNTQNDYEKLPYCADNFVPGLVLVSTIDGKFSAVNSEGSLLWEIDTEPGPLLTSNIHNLELTNSGKWIRIIPSLTGSLYRFDGITIESIPITAESLLKSSFKYSEDLVIAGGLEVTTYGVGFRTGKIFYTCSSLKCTNNSNSDNKVDDILLLERSTQIVRAVESQSGHERWNFSVGYHNLKLPQISCTDPHANLFNWNITAIVPDGVLLASKYQDNAKTTWQYHFSSPIVRVWKWNGHKISEINLFQVKTEKDPKEVQISPAIYLGMHKKQLYIHESYGLQTKEYVGTAIAETSSVAKIPWKPVSASGFLTEDDSTAISVLYSSEYVNGHGYYLYSEHDVKKKSDGLCQNNETLKISVISQKPHRLGVGSFLWVWWKEILVILLTTSFLFNIIFKSFARHHQKREIIFVERTVKEPSESGSESSNTFSSRFLNDFHTLRCLGKGGFGVVFEVKQKIDECHYAIKRIVLPNEENKREAVMREVKALAKLEHHNIVRYFNSWVENPPHGWQQEHDGKWIKETSEFPTESTTGLHMTSYNQGTDNIASSSQFMISKDLCNYKKEMTESNDSFVVFNESCSNTNDQHNSKKIDEKSGKTDTISCDNSQSLGGVNWRRPSRRYHSLCDTSVSKNSPVFLYIQMQLCQRQSLKEWLLENKDRQFTYILGIFKQIVSAVEYVHMQGLIHRDLKPSNIFFSLDGQIKVGDFGLVKDEEESHDAHNMLNPVRGHTKEVGTRLYMSPEQLNGQKYNYKVDIYSLGLIFFELLVYFSTDMERIKTLTDLRENVFPTHFMERHAAEHSLLTQMLCHLPEKRLTTIGIRARAPLNCCDTNYSETYDFELPKSVKTTGPMFLKS